MEAARLKKLQGGAANAAKVTRERPASTSTTPTPSVSINNKRPAPTAASNGLPFSDEMYNHLKFAIEKISGRMKSPKTLTPEEFRKLEASIMAIIRDAKSDSYSDPEEFEERNSQNQGNQVNGKNPKNDLSVARY